jgi:uncharacterized SAM-binding protein YcdF (DUF218 family)
MRKINYASISKRAAMFAGVVFSILTLVLFSLFISLPQLEKFLVVNEQLAHADALVVMAGETSLRLPAAARLFKEGKGDKILLTNDGIFSSWSEEKQRNLYDVEWAEVDLLKMGIPGSAIVKLTYSSSGTIFDALNTRKFALANGMKSLLVVTSDYHTRRSLWTFQEVFRGINIKISVFPVQSYPKKPLYIRAIVLGLELIKYVFYKAAY